MHQELVEKYVKLIVRSGANVQAGQGVTIRISPELADFGRMLVKEAYEAGAAWVRVDWEDQAITKLAYEYQSTDELATVKKWEEERLKYSAETLPARIFITSADPDGLKGMDQAKLSEVSRRQYPVLKPYHDAMENKYQWVIAGAPSVAWAKKIFPDLSEAEAVDNLWAAIFDTSRVSLEEDPLETWQRHNESFEARMKWLNDHTFSKIHYRSANGTDFRAGLLPQVLWAGGGEELKETKVFFQPNIPTEEIFTTPMRGDAEGKVVASKPLSYQGQLIDKFWIEFEAGKAVRWGAEQGEELLGTMLTMDEGAAYLGELALVPFESPVNQKGYLFWNTLYDENACCHLAVGRGFTNLVKDYDQYTREELVAMGLNESMIHVDFMIGTADLDIDGEKADGTLVPIFRGGTWAF